MIQSSKGSPTYPGSMTSFMNVPKKCGASLSWQANLELGVRGDIKHSCVCAIVWKIGIVINIVAKNIAFLFYYISFLKVIG